MAEGRFSARLAALSRAELLEFAARQCADDPAIGRRADAFLAERTDPLPDELLDGVLLSGELLPGIMACLEYKYSAAAAVCMAWKGAWEATNAGRRGLRLCRELEPDFNASCGFQGLTALPGDRLFVWSDSECRILDSQLQTISTHAAALLDSSTGPPAASSLGLFFGTRDGGGTGMRRHSLEDFSLEGERRIDDEDIGGEFEYLTLTPDSNTLFAVFPDDDASANDDIVCLDPHTLAVRFRFGRGRFKGGAAGLTVCGDELFVCDFGCNKLQVFSLGGEHRRDITGGFWRPLKLLHFDGRLYVVEDCYAYGGGITEEERTKKLGKRIFVLTPEGETLQVYDMPGGRAVRETAVVDRKLIVHTYEDSHFACCALTGA